MTDLAGFIPRKRPGQTTLNGRYIDMEPLEWDLHGVELAQHVTGVDNTNLWTFVPIGPFDDLAALQGVMSYVGAQFEWEIMAVKSKTSSKVLGTASYMRIREMHGSAEVGCVVFGQALQKTREAKEVIYLMAKHVFENLGYRRFEWKCHNGNDASKQAALRFGFTFEGVFRNDMVMKGKNRDTAWFSMIDTEWPVLSAVYQAWLAPNNFNNSGHQKQSLRGLLGVKKS